MQMAGESCDNIPMGHIYSGPVSALAGLSLSLQPGIRDYLFSELGVFLLGVCSRLRGERMNECSTLGSHARRDTEVSTPTATCSAKHS